MSDPSAVKGIPVIAETGASISDFVPSGWKVRDSVFCDFNNDNIKDFAAVIQMEKPVMIPEKYCSGDREFHLKYLIIGFKSADQKYHLSASTYEFFGLCNWGFEGHDPFLDLSTRKNSLKVECTSGTKDTVNHSYYFQYRNADWFLIGYTSTVNNSGNGSAYISDYNFLNGSFEMYTIENKTKRDFKSVRYGKEPLKKLKGFTASEAGVEGIPLDIQEALPSENSE